MKIECEMIDAEYGNMCDAICPSCNNKCDIEYRDYVEKFPMVWCWTCQSKFVLDYPLDEFNNFLHENMEHGINTFTLDLLKIKKIANCEVSNKLKEEYTYYYLIDDCDKEKIKKTILDNVGVELNSYNIRDIQNEYPEYNLDHDGNSIFIEVIDKNGKLIQIEFSGD